MYSENDKREDMKNPVNRTTRAGGTRGRWTRAWAVAAASMLISAQTVSAQDWNWSGAAGDGLWGTGGNWQQGTPPPPEAQGVFLGGGTTQTIAAGTVENPGTANDGVNTFGSIFGPEFGGTLNIYGTLNYHWVVAAVALDPNPAARSHLNLFDDGRITGVNMGLGVTWWFLAPFASMNLYGNSTAVLENLWMGGHLNIYDNARVDVTNLVINADLDLYPVSDGTRLFNIAGGTLAIPAGMGEAITNWIGRGIFRAYGQRYATNAFTITSTDTNTIVTVPALGGAIERIYLGPVPELIAGEFHQMDLLADFPGFSGAVVNGVSPGVSPANLPGTPAFQSSNPNVVTVNDNGLLQALNPGTATITATLGDLTSTNAVTVTVRPRKAQLVHRYSFNEEGGTTASDSVGGSAWDGAVFGSATLTGGQLVLDGTFGFVQVPEGVVSNMDAITIEAWASFPNPVNPMSALYGFGALSADNMAGANYISMIPHTTENGSQVTFGMGDPTVAAPTPFVLQAAMSASPLDGLMNVHIVAVYHSLSGTISYYTNGVLAATFTENPFVPASFKQARGISLLNHVLGANPMNVIGSSLSSELFLNGSIDEFRIYEGPMSAAVVRANHALGPNQLIGTNQDVTLSVELSGDNVIIRWPIDSALVNLTSTTDLTGTWTPVNGRLSIVNDEYQVTEPAAEAARFFRLEE